MTSQVPIRQKAPKLQDRGCENMLSGQGYSTPQGALTGEYAEMGKQCVSEAIWSKVWSSIASCTMNSYEVTRD